MDTNNGNQTGGSVRRGWLRSKFLTLVFVLLFTIYNNYFCANLLSSSFIIEALSVRLEWYIR